jgi:hypothetical protein
VFRNNRWEPNRVSIFADKRRRRRARSVLLSETEDTCAFCKKFSPSSHPVGYIRMRHLMNHYVERHGFRLDPQGPDGRYFYESEVGEPRFFLASRRRLRHVDPRRWGVHDSVSRLSRSLSDDEALILSSDKWGNQVEATVIHVSDLAALLTAADKRRVDFDPLAVKAEDRPCRG